MPANTIKIWKLSTARGARRLELPDISSLDTVTRQLPKGYYSTFRTFGEGKRVIGLQAHLQRLYKPAAAQHITASIEADELRRCLTDILTDYKGEARVRIIMTEAGQFYIAVEPLKILPPEIYLHGVKTVTIDLQRESPRLKTTSFISASENERAEISRSPIFEALLVRNESIVEGMTSNFFYIKDGALGTARENILLGVTRQMVLRVARGSGVRIVYSPLKREQVPALSEAFLTSSSRGIVPIIQIDHVTIGDGFPGPITQSLMDGYKVYVMEHTDLI